MRADRASKRTFAFEDTRAPRGAAIAFGSSAGRDAGGRAINDAAEGTGAGGTRHETPQAREPLFRSGYALRASDTVVDIVGVCARRLGHSVDVSSDLIPLSAPLMAHDQGTHDACVASSIAFAIYLRAIAGFERDSVLRVLRDQQSAPSPAHAYHSQRRDECVMTGRVACGRNCRGVCDVHAGTVLPFMLNAVARGIVTEGVWPYSSMQSPELANQHNSGEILKRNSHYTLDVAEEINPDSPDATNSLLEALSDNCPVLMNVYVYASQKRFYAAHNHPNRLAAGGEHGTDGTNADSKHGRPDYADSDVTDVFADIWSMPAASGKRMPMGHCMTMTGFDSARRRFKIRNSFGAQWGCDGDFNWPFELVNGHSIHSLVIIRKVSVYVPDA